MILLSVWLAGLGYPSYPIFTPSLCIFVIFPFSEVNICHLLYCMRMIIDFSAGRLHIISPGRTVSISNTVICVIFFLYLYFIQFTIINVGPLLTACRNRYLFFFDIVSWLMDITLHPHLLGEIMQAPLPKGLLSQSVFKCFVLL